MRGCIALVVHRIMYFCNSNITYSYSWDMSSDMVSRELFYFNVTGTIYNGEDLLTH
jgi:hypothetical protein